MSSVDHRNGMNETVDAAAIASIIAKKRQSIPYQRINQNQNHHRMMAHSVWSRAPSHHPTAKGTRDQRHHVMQMVWCLFLFLMLFFFHIEQNAHANRKEIVFHSFAKYYFIISRLNIEEKANCYRQQHYIEATSNCETAFIASHRKRYGEWSWR